MARQPHMAAGQRLDSVQSPPNAADVTQSPDCGQPEQIGSVTHRIIRRLYWQMDPAERPPAPPGIVSIDGGRE